MESDEESQFSSQSELDTHFERIERKHYATQFEALSAIELKSWMDRLVARVAEVCGLQINAAGALLLRGRWRTDVLLERYIEDPDVSLSAAGVSRAPEPLLIAKSVDCDICCEIQPLSLALHCNHRYCHQCYDQYLNTKIMKEAECVIACPADCGLAVTDHVVQEATRDDPHVYERLIIVTNESYQSLLMRNYVEHTATLCWCPTPNCESAVSCLIIGDQLSRIVPTVTCKSNHTFCFGCGYVDHQPSPCGLVALWRRKCQDDSETANWIAANTKECVKCRSTIEKNGGCNHMTCKKCKTEFCWVCLGPWSEHGSQFYSCNRFTEKSSMENRDSQTKSRATLERYLHYYNRYANHEQSAKLDRDLYHNTEKKMEELQKSSDFSWIEVQFLKKAVEVLLQSRGTLQWTYCFAFYLARNNTTELFEDNQRDLEMSVEILSGLLENPIDMSRNVQYKQQVLDKTAYLHSRREVLLNDTCKGLYDQRWIFKTT